MTAAKMESTMVALPLLALLLVVPVQKEQTPLTKAWSILKNGLSDTHADKRSKAVHALQNIRQSSEAEGMAETALKDPSSEVRAEAAAVLGKLQDKHAIPNLRDALQDPDIKVVLSAAEALYDLHDPKAFDVYYAILTGERKSSESLLQSQLDILRNRKQLEKLVFETGIGFVPFGSMSYEAWKTITHDASTPVRTQAAERLAKDPDPRSGKALLNALYADKWQIRAAAANALGERGNTSLASDLTPILYDNNETVRYEAAAAIIQLSKVERTTRKRR